MRHFDESDIAGASKATASLALRRRRNGRFAGFTALSVAALLGACSEAPQDAIRAAPSSELDAVAVHQAVVARETAFDGKIEAVNRATVSAQTSGRIEVLPFDVGDYVKKGELIVQITATEQRARVDSAVAALTEAKARLVEVEAQHARSRQLYDKRLIAKAPLDTAIADLNSSRARVESADAAITEAKQGVHYTEVRAPYSGIVEQRHVELGETVTVGKPLMTGLSLEHLRVAVEIPQQHIGPLRQHRQARAILPDGRSVAVTELRLPPNADPNTQTFRVLATLPQGDYGVFPGMLVKVAFVSGEQRQLLLPAAALVQRGEVTGAYVLGSSGNVSFRYLRIGSATADGNWPVLSGLRDGEQVVTDSVAAARVYYGGGAKE